MWKLTSKPFVRKDEHFAFKLLHIKNSNTYIPLVQIFHPPKQSSNSPPRGHGWKWLPWVSKSNCCNLIGNAIRLINK